jgi:hypothetical protein
MALVLPNGGEVLALSYMVNKATPENLVLCLYQSNTTPAESDVIGTYTEATFTGYSNVTLTGASWTVVAGAPSTASYAQQTFTSSAGSRTSRSTVTISSGLPQATWFTPSVFRMVPMSSSTTAMR